MEYTPEKTEFELRRTFLEEGCLFLFSTFLELEHSYKKKQGIDEIAIDKKYERDKVDVRRDDC